jgi:hypothetical protein
MVGTIREDQGWSYGGIAQETISGGQFVKAMSAGAAGTLPNVALVDAAADHLLAVGVATNNATSGGIVGYMMKGVGDFYCHTAVVAGTLVGIADGVASADAVIPITTSLWPVQGSQVFGRALTSAASGALTRVVFNTAGGF